VEVKPTLQYQSSSETDVSSVIQRARRKEDKRLREFEFIRKSCPVHIYIVGSKDLLKARRTSRKDLS